MNFNQEEQTLSGYNFSYWEKDVWLNDIDIVVVGAGIVGLSTAIALNDLSPKLRLLVLDRGCLPMGASTRNAGFACFGSISELESDLKASDEATIKATVALRWEGLELLRKRLGDAALDYQDVGGTEVFTSRESFEAYADTLSMYNTYMRDWIGLNQVYTIRKKAGNQSGLKTHPEQIFNHYEGLIHPGKMIKGLIKLCEERSISILWGTELYQWEEMAGGVSLQVRGGSIKSQKVIFTTNGLARQFMPDLEVAPARNTVLITQPVRHQFLDSGYHMDGGYIYFRPVGNRILLGGCRNLVPDDELTDDFGRHPIIQEALETLLFQNLFTSTENLEIDQYWSGILGIGSKKSPIIESIGKNALVAVRMGGMGVAIGSKVGEIAAKRILELSDESF
jgi:gamma-glutamylputrescine oxidase